MESIVFWAPMAICFLKERITVSSLFVDATLIIVTITVVSSNVVIIIAFLSFFITSMILIIYIIVVMITIIVIVITILLYWIYLFLVSIVLFRSTCLHPFFFSGVLASVIMHCPWLLRIMILGCGAFLG